ncbi:MAG TPA: iron ABC transporter permease [Thermoanaerobaculia bacterium]|nr:iron ABC transporter permease [Thermoanaerobaculia bacterium]
MRRTDVTALVAIAALLAGAAVSLMVGPYAIERRTLLDTLSGARPDTVESQVIFTIRMPRLVAACISGWALAIAGLVFQALLRNPLASEYTLGVSSGAALGAVAATLLGLGAPLATPAFAFAGAVATIALVLLLARARLAFETNAAIMIGVIFTALANAALSLILSIVSPFELQAFFFWFMGSFAEAEWRTLVPAALAIALLSGIIYAFSWNLNAIAVDEQFAAQIGVDVEVVKTVLLIAASFLTAIVVSLAGTVGFVGLVVPHMVRLAIGVDHRALIPVTALFGAALCVAADVLARTTLAPNELPVGVVTAFIGVPVFVALMRRPRA